MKTKQEAKERLVDTKYLFEDFDDWVLTIDAYEEYGTQVYWDYINYAIDYYAPLLSAATVNIKKAYNDGLATNDEIWSELEIEYIKAVEELYKDIGGT